MSAAQILLLFFGLPLAILVMGLRRAIGAGRMLVLVLGAGALGTYGLLLKMVTSRTGGSTWAPVPDDLPAPARELVWIGAAALLGMLGAALVRFRGQGSMPLKGPLASGDGDRS